MLFSVSAFCRQFRVDALVVLCCPSFLSFVPASAALREAGMSDGILLSGISGRSFGSIIIMIMYIYHALINALSAHVIYISLNVIFYSHVEHSPTKTVYIKYYAEKQTLLCHALHTHTHTHTHTPVSYTHLRAHETA